jgi:hypothetical protein
MRRLQWLGYAALAACATATTAGPSPPEPTRTLEAPPATSVYSCENAPASGVPPRECPDGCEDGPTPRCPRGAKLGDRCDKPGELCLLSGTIGRCKGPLGGRQDWGFDPCAGYEYRGLRCAAAPAAPCYVSLVPVP